MNAEEQGKKLAKSANNVMKLCLSVGGIGIFITIVNSLQSLRFTGIPLFPLLVAAEGVLLFFAFKEESMDKAVGILYVLKIHGFIIISYSVYSLVMYLVGALAGSALLQNYYFSLGAFAGYRGLKYDFLFYMANYTLAFLASLAIVLTEINLSKNKIERLITSNNIILLAAICMAIVFVIAGLIVTNMLVPIIIMLVFMFIVIPVVGKLLRNPIVKGAIIGGIIAGDVGAVVGAVAASNKQQK